METGLESYLNVLSNIANMEFQIVEMIDTNMIKQLMGNDGFFN